MTRFDSGYTEFASVHSNGSKLAYLAASPVDFSRIVLGDILSNETEIVRSSNTLANIKRAIDGEFYFYSRVFGFEPADDLEPVEIYNL